ncbi:MAG TPA: CbtA family protein [Paracoccaceae bacterium]|nr:CbtA family protein [Paracoccaceae bacterium]
MIRQILASAMLAGLVAGAFASVTQQTYLLPVLLEAERYESGEVTHFGTAPAAPAADAPAAHDHAEAVAPHSHAAPADDGGLAMRFGLTLLSQLVTFVGFGLLLVAGFALAARAGHEITARSGILWGLAGFAALQLLPAAGLAPELPGSAGAALAARQAWWLFAVLASAAGLAALAFGRGPALAALGVLLLAAPHIVGAPHPAAYSGVAPPELAALFSARGLATGAAAWAVLGLAAGHFWARERRALAPQPA